MSVASKKRFIVEINGIPQFYAQKVTFPKKTFGETKYNIGTREKKVPDGSFTVGDLTIEGLFFTDQTQEFVKKKIEQIASGVSPDVFMEYGRIILLGTDFITPLKIFELQELWVKEHEVGELDASSSDPVMEKITFSVGDYKQVKL